MIEMSGNDGAALGVLRPKRRVIRERWPWHVVCNLLVLSGCLYVAPIERPPVNHAPLVLIPADTEDLLLVLVADVERVEVAAIDEDGDELQFYWSTTPSDVGAWADPTWPAETEDGEVLWFSQFNVPRDVRLDGRQIECTVIDLEGKDAVVEWVVEVEE